MDENIVKLKDVFENVKFEDVFDALIKQYPELSKFFKNYWNAYDAIKRIKDLKQSIMTICFIRTYDKFGQKDQINVMGKVNGNAGYSIDMIQWAEWLTMPIDKDVLEKYSYNEIAAYCLYEMTYKGFDEDTIHNF